MKRNPRPWTKTELALLGAKPDAAVAELTGRTFGTVWQKRRALGIRQPALRFRKWTPAEDKLVGTAPDAKIALRLGRSESAIKSRRAIFEREQAKRETKPRISDPKPCPAVLRTLGVHPVAVPRDPSLADDDRYKLIDGPYYPQSDSVLLSTLQHSRVEYLATLTLRDHSSQMPCIHLPQSGSTVSKSGVKSLVLAGV
jgi:hypothetical protein